MGELPIGVERRSIDGVTRLVTRGEPVYGEPTDGPWRAWDPNRSKLAAMLELRMDVGLDGEGEVGQDDEGEVGEGDAILYLGAASGTTVSHVADFAGPTYAVEFAPRSARDLLDVAEARTNLFPLFKDARKPETYAHVVESGLDAVIQDVATRGQARVALENRRFLADDGRLLLAVKARSEDVTRDPAAVYEEVRRELETGYEILDERRLDDYHIDHLGIVARPR